MGIGYDHQVTIGDLITGLFLSLAVARGVRVVIVDTIAEPLRRFVVAKFGPSSKLVVLIYCPWCLSWWFSLAAAVFAALTGLVSSWPAALVMIPACSYGAAAISMQVEREQA